MKPTEYYLNLLGAPSGHGDCSNMSGRVLTAAIMTHFDLLASNRAELISLLDIRQSPGFLLAQKEDTKVYNCLRSGMDILRKIVSYEKIGKTMHYRLSWQNISNMTWSIGSPELQYIAMIYWVGFFLFGRNVIPEDVLTNIQNISIEEGVNQNIPFIKRFLQDIGVEEGKEDIYPVKLSLLCALTPSSNYLGSLGLLSIFQPDTTKNIRDALFDFDPTKDWRPDKTSSPAQSVISYDFYTYSPGYYKPNGRLLDVNSSCWPLRFWESVALFFTDLDTSQIWMRESGSYLVRSHAFQAEFRHLSLRQFITASILWELHLFLTGEPLYELTPTQFDREGLLNLAKVHFMPEKNYTLHRLFEVHLERVALV